MIAATVGRNRLAYKILRELPERYTISHFCSTSLKDGNQLRNRYKRRAESIQYPYEEVTDDGTLLYLRITSHDSERIDQLYGLLRKQFRISQKNDEYFQDLIRKRIQILPWFLTEKKVLRL